jgi:hypothetical protein
MARPGQAGAWARREAPLKAFDSWRGNRNSLSIAPRADICFVAAAGVIQSARHEGTRDDPKAGATTGKGGAAAGLRGEVSQ